MINRAAPDPLASRPVRRLRAVLALRGLDLTDLATALHVSDDHLLGAVRERRPASERFLVDLAQYLGWRAFGFVRGFSHVLEDDSK